MCGKRAFSDQIITKDTYFVKCADQYLTLRTSTVSSVFGIYVTDTISFSGWGFLYAVVYQVFPSILCGMVEYEISISAEDVPPRVVGSKSDASPSEITEISQFERFVPYLTSSNASLPSLYETR